LSVLAADTSVWSRRRHPDVGARWVKEVLADNVGITPIVALEVLYSARSAAEYDAMALDLAALRQVPCDQAACARAMEVQRLLAQEGALHHRSVGVPDLLIAAAAELAGATVWHYDEDFDRIAAVTGQPVEWVLPRGSL
jgi:predicted nucleic acid-binding protein